MNSWVPGADGSGFGVENLPYGVFSTEGVAGRTGPRVGTRIGGHILDLAAVARAGLLDGAAPNALAVFSAPLLNPFMAYGRPVWTAVRRRLRELLAADIVAARDHRAELEAALVRVEAVRMHLPVVVADYVDFYSSLDHAENLGRMFRPDAAPLLPNWRHLPVGYHGRAGTLVVSGTPVRRPNGQRRQSDGEVAFGPSARLDIELEVGFLVGATSEHGQPVPGSAVADHVFGVVLVNDWSARDIQAWEYQPLGPFLGKSFATSMSAWVTPLDALQPARVPPPMQEPPPLPYLTIDEPWGLDIDLEVALRPGADQPEHVIARTNFAPMYWTVAQQLAHMTVNGASLRTGDLFASGTVSGPGPKERGSLIELSWNGTDPIELAHGISRSFLEDGDEVVLRGSTAAGGARIDLGECRGRIEPATHLPGEWM
ncbi:MAG: fumarylacetoacetase [Acidimicrobiales bacterium]